MNPFFEEKPAFGYLTPSNQMRFTEEELVAYRNGKNINTDFLEELRHISSCDKRKMEQLLDTRISDRQYFLIKEEGMPAAAWLIPAIDWELASLATRETSYAEMILRLAENEIFLAGLFSPERQALLLLAASYRSPLLIFQYDVS